MRLFINEPTVHWAYGSVVDNHLSDKCMVGYKVQGVIHNLCYRATLSRLRFDYITINYVAFVPLIHDNNGRLLPI